MSRAFPGIQTPKRIAYRYTTNSLASHDVPAVNSHYQPWRKSLPGAGVDLYEFRADPAIKPMIDAPAVDGKFSGLHTKAAAIDEKLVFIGSMNLDPRSASINTGMGAVIESPGLAAEVRRLMLRDMQGENSWRVTLTDEDRLEWTNSEQTVQSQPSRGFLQVEMNSIFKVAPKKQF